MSFNKVDAALKSVGISLQTADHQFRDFTDVILELSEVWDTLESTQQRYIATQFAGNRQQSRFLALVSNADLLRENMRIADESEDTGTLQALKALDSLESKINQVQVAYQQFYTTIGAEQLWKTLLDGLRNFIDSLNSLPKLFNTIPLGAITVISDAVSLIRTAGLAALSAIAKPIIEAWNLQLENAKRETGEKAREIGENIPQKINEGLEKNNTNNNSYFNNIIENFKNKARDLENAANLISDKINLVKIMESYGYSKEQIDDAFGFSKIINGLAETGRISQETANKLKDLVPSELLAKLRELQGEAQNSVDRLTGLENFVNKYSGSASNFGMALYVIANALDKSSASGRIFAGVLMSIYGIMKTLDSVSTWLVKGGKFPWLAVAAAAVTIVNGLATAIETSQEKLERLTKEAENLNNEAKKIKADYNTLQRTAEKFDELKEKRHESTEAEQEYQAAVEELAEKVPGFIVGMDEAGDAIIETSTLEYELEKARKAAAQATLDAAKAERVKMQEELKQAERANKSNLETLTDSNSLSNLSIPTSGGLRSKNFNVKDLSDAGLIDLEDYRNFLNESGGAPDLSESSLLSILSNYGIQGIKWDDRTQKTIIEDADTFFESIQSIEEFAEDGPLHQIAIALTEATKAKGSYTAINEASSRIKGLENLSGEEFEKELQEIVKFIGKEELNGIFEPFLTAVQNYTTGLATIDNLKEALNSTKSVEISGRVQQLVSSEEHFFGSIDDGQSIINQWLIKQADAFEEAGKGTYEQYIAVGGQIEEDFESIKDSLTPEQWEKFGELWKSRDQYSKEDWRYLFSDADEEFYKAIDNYYITNGMDYVNQFKKNINSKNSTLKNKVDLNAFSLLNFTSISKDVYDWLSQGLETIEDYGEEGYTATVKNLSQQMVAVVNDLDSIDNPQLKGQVSNILKDTSYTKEGLNKTIEDLEQYGSSTEKIRESLGSLRDTLIYNYPLAIQTMSDEISSQFEDIDKAIKKSYKGYDATEINDVLKVIEKASGREISIEELIWKNGQAFLPEEFREIYINGLIQSTFEDIKDLRKNIDNLFKSKEGKTELNALENDLSEALWGFEDFSIPEEITDQTFATLKELGLISTSINENGEKVYNFSKELLALAGEEGFSLKNYIITLLSNSLNFLEMYRTAIESAQNAATVEAKKESQEKLSTLLSEVQKGVNGFISKENGDLLSQLGEDVIDLGEPLEDGSYQIKAIKDEVALYKFILEHFQETGQATKDQIATARQLLYDASNKQKTAGEAFVNSIKNASVGEELLLDQDQFELLNTLSDDDLKELGLELNRETATIKRLENSSIEAILRFFSNLAASSQEAVNKLIAEGAEADWNLSIDKVIADVIGDLDNISFEAAENLKKTLQLDNETFNQLLKQYGNHYVGDESLLSYITAFLLSTQGAISDYTKDSLTEAENSLVDKLQKAGEALEGGVGARVDDITKEIGDAAGYTFEKSGSKWLITSVGNVELAHQLIYDQMVANDYVTVEQLNEARENLVESHRKEQTSMLEELEGVEDAKGGDWLDFTNFSKDLTEAQIELLNNSLGQYGAVIQDGILKIEEGANILGIQQILYKQAQESGKLLDSELAGLRDAIINTIAGYSELISNGIAGSLTQVDAANLQAFASNYNLQIDFHQTEEGLKLSQRSANELYLTMKQVDYLQSRVLFKDLSDNLKESRDAYKDVVSIQGHIADLQREINSLPVGSARRKEYEQELEVAKEIREVRSLTDEDAFDFMGRDLPTPYKAQLGYWDSIGSAFKEMNDAAESGYMDVTKFYNMVNGFNEMASNMGSSITFMGMELDGSMESASKLIQKGFDSLSNVDGDGAKISLEKFGDTFADGAKGMQSGVQSGVRDMAKTQIKMLDAMIQFLETIVAFDDFNELDLNGDGLQFEELFKDLGNGSSLILDGTKEAAQKIIKASESNKDLLKGLQTLRVDGVSAYQMVEDINNKTTLTTSKAKDYAKTIEIMAQAAKDGDFSTQNLTKLVQEAFSIDGEYHEIDIGDRTFSIKGDIFLEKDKNGYYTVGGQKFKTWKDAEAAYKLLETTGAEQVFTEGNKVWAYLEVKNGVSIKVETDVDTGEQTFTNTADPTQSYTSLQECQQAIIDKAISDGYEGTKAEYIIENDLITKWHLTATDFVDLTGQPISNLPDKILADLGIDTNLVYAIQAGVQRAFTNFNFMDVIFDNLLGPQNEETSTWEDNPKLQEVGRQLGTGIVRAVIDGVTNETETNPNGISSAVASGIEDKNGEVEGAANNLAGVVTGILTALSDPNGAIKNAGMDAAQSFVEGFTLTNSNDGISSFSEVFGQQISSAVIGPIRDALVDLFSETSLSEIIPLFATNSDLTLTFDSIKIDSLIEITNGFKDAISAANEVLQSVIDTVNELKPDGPANAFAFKEALNNIRPNGSIYASSFQRALNDITNNGSEKAWNFKNALEAIGNIHAVASIEINITGSGWSANAHWEHGLAKGNAFAKGHPTLMGELGPELYVTGGRYYVAGQNGAEMVDLPDDAIVFNHLQTKRLLGSGHAGRGKPVTNEKNAVSYATGNVSGPALASAREILNLLKALRSMWESMLNASFKDLGGLAKSNKDKSKTGKDPTDTDSGSEDSIKNVRTSDDLQRWYNLTRQIDKLEKDIAYQESLINNYQNDRVANGKLIHASYKNQLNMLDQELAKNRELYKYQVDFVKQKRKEIENSAWSKIISFDENGLLQLHGMDILERLNEENIYGEGINTSENVQQQLRYLAELGFDLNDFKYNDDDLNAISHVYNYDTIYDEHGNLLTGQDKIDAQEQIMNNWWSQLDAIRDEYDEGNDAVLERKQENLELLNQQNEILQKYVDNQLEVENTILDVIVDARQAEIDELQKQRDAYEDSVNKMIEGLNKALDNERQIYENQQSRDDLTKLQRQLAILQRSGGSTSQIRNLQNQISSKQQDMYFDRRQEEIDAIQEASDKQLAAMETQINLMTETLEYQKQHGLLWNQVYQVMSLEESQILSFISGNSSEWASKSTLAKNEDLISLGDKIGLWIGQRDDDVDRTIGERLQASQNTLFENIKNLLGPEMADFEAFLNAKGVDWRTAGEGEIINAIQEWGLSKHNESLMNRINEIVNLCTTLTERGDSSFNPIEESEVKEWLGEVQPPYVEVTLELGEDGGVNYNYSSTNFNGTVTKVGNSNGQTSYSNNTSSLLQNVQESSNKSSSLIGRQVTDFSPSNKFNIATKSTGTGSSFTMTPGGSYDFNIVKEGHSSALGEYYKLNKVKTNGQPLSPSNWYVRKKDLDSLLQYRNGGLIDFTGPAWVDGSRTKPEAILSAEDTAALRNGLLGTKINLPQISTSLQALQELLTNHSNSNTSITDGNIYIDTVELNMQAQIANDYDANRAGQQVLNEFVRLARKNGVNSVSRR